MKCLAAALVLAAAVSPASAFDRKMVEQLKKLDPRTRLEQRCDIEAQERIARDETGHRPDKVIAYTFSDPEIEGTSISAPGAVFRSAGDWYRLSFDCTTGPKRLKVRAFDYDIGEKVSRSDWEEFYLYD